MKVNATITILDLKSEVTIGQGQGQNTNNNDKTGSRIGDEGARALSDALKVNTALEKLILLGAQQQDDDKQWHNIRNNEQSRLRDERGRSLCNEQSTQSQHKTEGTDPEECTTTK